MIIANNLSAIKIQGYLKAENQFSEKSINKLSSGYQINQAADNAAGLYISEKMRVQIRGLNQSSLNGQDGISLIQTAEGGTNEVYSIICLMEA